MSETFTGTVSSNNTHTIAIGGTVPSSFNSCAEAMIPAQQEIDALVDEYVALEAAADFANQQFKIARDQLIATARLHGYLPPRSEKSKRLMGGRWKVTVSQGHSVEIDGTAAAALRKALRGLGQRHRFRQLFRRETVYVLQDGAQCLMARLELPAKVRALFLTALQIKVNAPRVEVEQLAAGS